MNQVQNQKRLSQSPQRTQRKPFILVPNPENHPFFASLAPRLEAPTVGCENTSLLFGSTQKLDSKFKMLACKAL
jgi:hypothetical protein